MSTIKESVDPVHGVDPLKMAVFSLYLHMAENRERQEASSCVFPPPPPPPSSSSSSFNVSLFLRSGEEQRERETENPKEALHYQHKAQCGAPTKAP